MPDVSMSGISIRIVSDSTEASRAIATLTKQIDKLNSTLSRSNGIRSFSSQMSKLSGSSKGGFSAFKVIAAPFKSGFQDVSRFAKGLGGVFNAFKRIAMYRILRSIIKEITQAFAEGTKNLYGWSKAVGGATMYGKKFAQTMDSLATSGGYFKNSIGAMVGPIVSALAPAIDFIVDKIVALINVINQLFALLGGATSWNKATRKAQEFEDAAGGAGGAAKEALRYLAPFDELNVLPDEKSGGGGGGGTDYSGMFEETSEFMEGLKDFVENIKDLIKAEKWDELGQLLGEKVNELVEKVPWGEMGAKVGGFINAWFTTRYWTLETINFQNIGAKIAEFFNNAISKIDFEIIGRTVVQKFTIVGDFIIGAINNINWVEVANSIGQFFRGSLNQLSDWIGKVNWQELTHNIYTSIKNALTTSDGVDWNGIISSIMTLIGSGIGAAAAIIMQLGLDLALDIWNSIKSAFNGADSNADGKLTGTEIINGIKRGIVNAVTSIYTWVKENIWTPFLNGIKSAFGIASPAATMEEPGQMIGEGILQGIASKFTGLVTWIRENIWNPFIQTLKSLFGISEGSSSITEASGKSIGQGILDGIASIFVNIGTWIDENLIQPIIEAAKGLGEAIKEKITGGGGGDDGHSGHGGSIEIPVEFEWQYDPVTMEWVYGPVQVPAVLVTDYADFKSRLETLSENSPVTLSFDEDEGLVQTIGTHHIKIPVTIDDSGLDTDVSRISDELTLRGNNNPFKIPTMLKMSDTGTYDEVKSDIEQKSQANPVSINVSGKITSATDGLTAAQKTINSTANWTDWKCYGSKDSSKVNSFTTWKSTANWNDYQVYGSKSGSSIAKFTTWSSTANFSRRVYDTSKIQTDGDNIKLNATANITKATGKTNVTLTATAKGGFLNHGVWNDIPQYASGTSKAHGSLFIAGEAGPEVVGHIGGRTEVLNRSQLAATMYSAVTSALASLQFNVTAPSYSASTGASEGDTENMLYRAFVRAIEDTGMDDPSIELDGDTLYKSVVRRNRQNTRATGVNQLAMA